MGKAGRPYRVLDLASGSGLVRFAVGRRVPVRPIRYTGIDKNRSHLEPVGAMVRTAERTGRPLPAITDASGHALPGVVEALQARLSERYVRTELELHDEHVLVAQLRGLLGRERFDEIHVHLLHPGTHGAQPNGHRVLRAVATYLRPGARLYHLFQSSSPFFDFKPEFMPLSRDGCPPPGSHGDVIGRDGARFSQGAARAGLLLDKCGYRWRMPVGPTPATVSYENWVTRRFASAAPDRRTAETYQRAAEQYSDYCRFATHFVILRKRPRLRPSAPAAGDGRNHRRLKKENGRAIAP